MNTQLEISRRGALQMIGAGAAVFATQSASAAAPAAVAKSNPGKQWEKWAKPQDAGFANDLTPVLDALYPSPTSTFMIIRGGKVVMDYGFPSQISYLASARKSIMSMLYGKYVANGTIKLNTTMAELGIDDMVGLTAQEKQATVRHLLMSSSGVYTPQGSPGGDQSTPPRDTYKPGEHFHYNNWDFNVAGAVFTQLTGKGVHQALKEDLADPLGFEDFDINRQRMMGYEPPTSKFLAYHTFLSGRDMARLGLLMVNGGRWNGQQIIPEAWVKESTTAHVKQANKENGYGYLWWIPTLSRTSKEWVGSYTANGNYGQYIVGMPAVDMVIVHRRAVSDAFAIARNLGKTNASPAGGGADILALCDKVVAQLKA